MTIRVIDTETTGVDPAKDVILELASIDVVRAGISFDIQNSQQDLVALPPTWEPYSATHLIDPVAMATHHITPEVIKGRPQLREVINRYEGADAYIAHNCAFDRSFLEPHFGPKAWICTYKCALRIWPDAPGHSNQVLRYWLGLDNPFGWSRRDLPTHRALSDAVVTAAIFVEMLKAGAVWLDMVRWSSEPAKISRFTFGKHKGSKIEDVPPDYLDWIIFKSDMGEDVKFSAKEELARRSSKQRERALV